MRKRSDKDEGGTAPGTVQQIASANSTVNLFLGGSRVRSWMNGTAPSTVPHAKKIPVPSTAINRPLPTTTVFPSPAPSDEPSPTQETSPSRVVREERVGRSVRLPLVTSWETDTHAESQVVQSPEAMQSLTMIQRENINNEGQVVESPEAMQSPTMMQQGNTNTEGLDVRSPEMQQSPTVVQQGNTNNERRVLRSNSTQQSSPVIQQGHTNTERQTIRSPSTQQLPPMTQQGNTHTLSQEMRFLMSQQGNPYAAPQPLQRHPTQQPAPMNQQGHTDAEIQEIRSPSTQHPPPIVQQGHANTQSQAVQSPLTRPVLYSSHSPLAPAPPAKRRKMTSANHPSLKGMLPLIDQYVDSCGGMQALKTNIERQRFRMLHEACRNDDYFYLALHQMFCLWSLDPDLTARLTMPQGGTILKASFAVIGQLIMHNNTISEVHTKFFATFPNHLSELMYRSDQYSLTVNNVSIFLARLSLEWPKYIPECTRRGYPPLVDELVNRFGLLSPILQHIIFTATRRNIGIPDDEYSSQMEQLFCRDQELHRQMAARVNTAFPPTEREINERNQWQAQQYVNVRNMQIQRIEELRQARMGSSGVPTLQSNVPQRVQSPRTIPSSTQAGQSPPIRTNVMPSEVLTASPRSTTLPSPHHYPWPSQAPAPGLQTPNGSVSEHSSRSPLPNPVRLPSQSSRPPMPNPVRLPSQSSKGYPISPNQQNMQQPYQPNQMQNMQHRQGHVNDIARTASRNASRNSSLPQFSGAGSVVPSPVLTNPVRRSSSSAYSNSASALAAMPAGYSSPQPQPQPHQQVIRVPLIPPVGYTPPYQFPQPDRSALHQAHLRSPVLRAVDADDGMATDQPAQKYYQAVQSFAAGPTTLVDSPLLTELSFSVPKHIFRNVAEDKFSDPTAPLVRELQQGTLQYRVRCTRMNSGAEMEPSDFVVADTNWPPTIFMEINDSVLEIRRKTHHGKDRPVDITPHVFAHGPKKENMLRVSVPRPAKTANDILYSIAIEVVEVFRHQQIVDMCMNEQRVMAKDTIDEIRAKLSSSNADEDDDVALVSANLTIDLADPFTSRIFTTPVRGAKCRHRECFDLETFLISRSNKPQEVACMPDVWKCPLCGSDASPRSLRVDDFLVSVREKLEKDGDLDVKAILVTEDGSWTVKPEAAPAVRKKSRGGAGSVPREDGDHSSPAVPSRQGSRAVEVIEVDDD
ncbi:hypothetical protein V502_04618 [Pseudogymnoascus sp. VKM F-4520 (FW-2644)]|nr:hypothetical protein V502_04618 [Pseudogymnoascus sp. VKM F-4520 (FW-2644)]